MTFCDVHRLSGRLLRMRPSNSRLVAFTELGSYQTRLTLGDFLASTTDKLSEEAKIKGLDKHKFPAPRCLGAQGEIHLVRHFGDRHSNHRYQSNHGIRHKEWVFQAQALFGRYTISTELCCEVLRRLLFTFVVVFCYVQTEGAVNLNGILPFGLISWAGQKDCALEMG